MHEDQPPTAQPQALDDALDDDEVHQRQADVQPRLAPSPASANAAPTTAAGAALRRPVVWASLAGLVAVTALIGHRMLARPEPQRLEASLTTPSADAVHAVLGGHRPTLTDVPAVVHAPASAAASGATEAPELPAVQASDVSMSAVRLREPASAPVADTAAAISPDATVATAPGSDLAAKVAALEAQVLALTQALHSQGYVRPGAALSLLTKDTLLPYPQTAVTQAIHGAAPRQQARPRQVARAARPVREAPGAPAPHATQPSAKPDAGVQLLAVDLWAGTPSVVLGTTAPGDTRIKVMQPGDQVNGVALKRADLAGQRATFALRGGQEAELSVVNP